MHYIPAGQLNDDPVDDGHLRGNGAGARIGPNAVIQTLRALEELEGPGQCDRAIRQAGIDTSQLSGMIPEHLFIALNRAVRDRLPESRAAAVMRLAGTYTARYVASHRIPGLFRLVLGRMPPRLGIPLLLAAFRRHAWTFAGSARFGVAGPYPGTLVLEDCPTCRHGDGQRAAGAYYEAAFEGLLQIVAPRVRVREIRCRALGDPSCQFTIEPQGNTLDGESACASS
jgi:divinyl protochlorophyllide a 8-vinyl-reductase